MTVLESQVASLSERVTVDRHTSGVDLIELAFWNPIISGRFAHVHTVNLDQPVAPAALLDQSHTVLRSATNDTVIAVLAAGDGCAVMIRVDGHSTVISVAAESVRSCAANAEQIKQREPGASTGATSPVRVWHRSGGLGYSARGREIDTPSWADVDRNYPTAVRERLDWLHSLVEPTGAGKLILWHGEPGTGKTTAARSLFRSWEPWCAIEYVADPERFFTDPAYITDVIGRPTTAAARPSFEKAASSEREWRLIVAEDVDEILRTRSGDRDPGLGRLLNLADGVLGQGFNSLVLLTTNEPINRLHPALVRPGRALAQIEFCRFGATEARDWLDGTHPPPQTPATLAELFHLDSHADCGGATSDSSAPVGQYL